MAEADGHHSSGAPIKTIASFGLQIFGRQSTTNLQHVTIQPHLTTIVLDSITFYCVRPVHACQRDAEPLKSRGFVP
jgi:hypothetical protein